MGLVKTEACKLTQPTADPRESSCLWSERVMKEYSCLIRQDVASGSPALAHCYYFCSRSYYYLLLLLLLKRKWCCSNCFSCCFIFLCYWFVCVCACVFFMDAVIPGRYTISWPSFPVGAEFEDKNKWVLAYGVQASLRLIPAASNVCLLNVHISERPSRN